MQAVLLSQIRQIADKNSIDERADDEKNPIVGCLLAVKSCTKLRTSKKPAYFRFEYVFERQTKAIQYTSAPRKEPAEQGCFAADLLRHCFRLGVKHQLQKRTQRAIEAHGLALIR